MNCPVQAHLTHSTNHYDLQHKNATQRRPCLNVTSNSDRIQAAPHTSDIQSWHLTRMKDTPRDTHRMPRGVWPHWKKLAFPRGAVLNGGDREGVCV